MTKNYIPSSTVSSKQSNSDLCKPNGTKLKRRLHPKAIVTRANITCSCDDDYYLSTAAAAPDREETKRVMSGMDPGPSYEYFSPADEDESDYDSVDYWFQTGVPPTEEVVVVEEQPLEPEEPTYSYVEVECIVVDSDPRDDFALLVPKSDSAGMMHEEIVLERLRERYDCDLERCGCLVRNCGRFFDSYAQLAFHLSYSHRDTNDPGNNDCLVCGIALKHSKGLVTHLSSKHRALANEHHKLCMQQRQAEAAGPSYVATPPQRKRARISAAEPQMPQPLVEENRTALTGNQHIKFVASNGAYYVVRGSQIREDENNGEVYVEEVEDDGEVDLGPPVLDRQEDMMIPRSVLIAPIRKLATPASDRLMRYSERRLLGFSAEKMYSVVNNVTEYPKFVPWCTRADVKQINKSVQVAELTIGFPPIHEHYVSRVTSLEPNVVRSVCTDGRVFNVLETTWRFGPGNEGDPETSTLHFSLDFEFKSKLHAYFAHMFFDQVVKTMVGAFLKRTEQIYGPPSFDHFNSKAEVLAYKR